MLTFRNSFRTGLHAVLFVGILAVSSRQMTAQDRYAVIPTPGTEITAGQVQSDFTPAGTLSPQGANLIKNPGFESGTASWSFYSNGSAGFTVASPPYAGTGSGKVAITTAGTNIQLYQIGISLQPDTMYEVSFVARSNSGHDLEVSIGKFGSPYTNYGLLPLVCNLTSDWAVFSTSFRSANFTSPVSDARLQFWLVPYAASGDEFWIDEVTLTMVGGATSVGDGNDVPRGYVLEQNFPNPFNPSTRIRYALGEATYVKLTIHDVVGREVLRPVDAHQEAGYHEVHVDARDLASGVYFYRITTPGFVQAKRMILVK